MTDAVVKARSKAVKPRALWFVFFGIWLVVFAVPLVGMVDVIAVREETGWQIVYKSWCGLLPYFIVSAISECVLIPIFLYRQRIKVYVFSVVILLGAFAVYEHAVIKNRGRFKAPPENKEMLRQRPPLKIHPNVALPVIGRIGIAMLIIGCGLGINLMWRYRGEKQRTRELENYHLEQELAGLRAQISPHFFMNVLNNIHSAMDTDVKRAQDMLLKMSEMMRYVTYDSTLDRIPLNREVVFVKNYLSMMAYRYPAERVAITFDFPPESLTRRVSVPTMIFTTFIENAFKHGVTYRKQTRIDISIKLVESENGERIEFHCTNTLPPSDGTITIPAESGGVGLVNVRRRLEMLFGRSFELTTGVESADSLFIVYLSFPATDENTMFGN